MESNNENNFNNLDMQSKITSLEIENIHLKKKINNLQKLVNTYETQYSICDSSNVNNRFLEEFNDISPIFKSIPYVRRMNAFDEGNKEVIF
tara:strand:+ start:1714 stop:1986 length:273 start_codon:yes stop_codon:yes gene_type:complete